VGVAHSKTKLSLAIWATTQSKQAPKMAFKFNMRDIYHMVDEL
jgi:hypothetical protein